MNCWSSVFHPRYTKDNISVDGSLGFLLIFRFLCWDLVRTQQNFPPVAGMLGQQKALMMDLCCLGAKDPNL